MATPRATAPDDDEEEIVATPPRVSVTRPAVRSEDVWDQSRQSFDPRKLTNPSVRKLFGSDIARAEKAAALRRREEDADAAEAARAQLAQAKEADRARKAAVDEAKRKTNAAREAEFRSKNVEHYTDAYGMLQPVRHPDGRVRFSVGEDGRRVIGEERDEATGHRVRRVMDAYGRIKAEDANEYRTFDDDPAHIYRGGPESSRKPNDKTGWEKMASVDAAVESDSPALQAAAVTARTKLRDRLLNSSLAKADEERVAADLGIEQWRSRRTSDAARLKELDAKALELATAADEKDGGILGMWKGETKRAVEAREQLAALQAEQQEIRDRIGENTSEEAAMAADPEASKLQATRRRREKEIQAFRDLAGTSKDVFAAARKFRDMLPEAERDTHPILTALAAEKKALGISDPYDVPQEPAQRAAALAEMEKAPIPGAADVAKGLRELDAQAAALSGTGAPTDPAKAQAEADRLNAEYAKLNDRWAGIIDQAKTQAEQRQADKARAISEKRLMEAQGMAAAREFMAFNAAERGKFTPDVADLEAIAEKSGTGMSPEQAAREVRAEKLRPIEDRAGGPDMIGKWVEHNAILDEGRWGISPATREFVVSDAVYSDPAKVDDLKDAIRAKKVPGVTSDTQVVEALNLIDQRVASDQKRAIEQASRLPGWQDAVQAAGPGASDADVLKKWKKSGEVWPAIVAAYEDPKSGVLPLAKLGVELAGNAARKFGGGVVSLVEGSISGGNLWIRDKANAVAEWSGQDWLKTSPDEFGKILLSALDPQQSIAGKVGGAPNPRLDGVLSETASTIGQQLPGWLAAFAIASSRGGARAAGTAANAQKVLMGATYGLQNAAANYSKVFESLVQRDENGEIIAGAEEAHKAAMGAFTESFAVGVSELAPIGRVFEKIPMNGMLSLVGKIGKGIGEEVAQEVLATKLNNVITAGASGGATQDDELSLESLTAMTLGMGAVIAPGVILRNRQQAAWLTKNASSIKAVEQQADLTPAAWEAYKTKIAPTEAAIGLGALSPTDPEVTAAVDAIATARQATKEATDLESKVTALQKLHAVMTEHAPTLDRLQAEAEKSARLNEIAAQVDALDTETFVSRMESRGINPNVARQYAGPEYVQRQKDRVTGLVKVATGRPELLTKAEEQAIATDHLGNPVEIVYEHDGVQIVEERARKGLIELIPAAEKLFPTPEAKRKREATEQKKAAEVAEKATKGQKPAPKSAPPPLAEVKDEIPMGDAAQAATESPEVAAVRTDATAWYVKHGVSPEDAAAFAAEIAPVIARPGYSKRKFFTLRTRLGEFVESKGYAVDAKGNYTKRAEVVSGKPLPTATPREVTAEKVQKAVTKALSTRPEWMGKRVVDVTGKPEAKDGEGSGGMWVDIGSGKVYYDLDRIGADLESLPSEQHEARLEKQVGEELIHVVQVLAARKLYKEQKKDGEAFSAFLQRYYGEMWAEFSPEVQAAVKKLRETTPNEEPWQLAMEAIRAIVDQKRTGTTTEALRLFAKNLTEKARQILEAMLAVLRQAATTGDGVGKRAQAEIAAIEAILAESVVGRDSGSSNPVPTTVQDLATSDVKAPKNVDPEAFKAKVKEEAAGAEVSNDTAPNTSDAAPNIDAQANEAATPASTTRQTRKFISQKQARVWMKQNGIERGAITRPEAELFVLEFDAPSGKQLGLVPNWYVLEDKPRWTTEADPDNGFGLHGPYTGRYIRDVYGLTDEDLAKLKNESAPKPPRKQAKKPDAEQPAAPDPAPEAPTDPAQARLKAALDALRKRKEITGDGGRLASAALTGNPAFYSRLERAIDDAEFGQSRPKSPMQWAGVVQKWAKGWSSAGGRLNRAGISQDEIKWSGIMSWLAQQKRPLTKADVLEYVRGEGKVTFEEVVARDPKHSGQDIHDELSALGYGMDFDPHNEVNVYVGPDGEWKDFEDLPPNIQAVINRLAPTRETRYKQYALPGGENYREVVLAMRNTKGLSQSERLEFEALEDERRAGGPVSNPSRYNELSGKAYRDRQDGYTSPHFSDAPNYVAHYRAQDFGDGTVIEELQSDRHQAARKKGYREEPSKDRIFQRDGKWRINGVYDPSVNFKTREEAVEYYHSTYNRHTIPDAPHRKTWPLALFKRALREAVETGKNWIGWPEGAVIADRFDLSKRLSRISYEPVDGGLYDFTAFDLNGTEVISEEEIDLARIEELAGKEIAEKVQAGEGRKDDEGYRNWHHLEGLDLKVGGEGMQGFYDDILPKEIGRYVRQWGAKVEKADSGIVIQNTTERFDPNTGKRMWWQMVPIWRIDITPEMRESVAKGQALFSAPASQPTAEDYAIYTEVAAAAYEAGIRTPGDFARMMVENFGDEIGPRTMASIWSFSPASDPEAAVPWTRLIAEAKTPPAAPEPAPIPEVEAEPAAADGTPDAPAIAPEPAPQPAAVAEASEAPAPPEIQEVAVTGVESLAQFFGTLSRGETTPAAIQAAWEWTKGNRDLIARELGKMTLKQLERFQGMRKPDNKAQAVRQALMNFISNFTSTGSYSIDPMGGDIIQKLINAIEPQIAGWTEEKLAKVRQDRADAKAAHEKALTNPETKEEWEKFVYRKGRQALTPDEVKEIIKTRSPYDRSTAVMAKGESLLTPEELAAYDAIRGIDRKAQEQREVERKAVVHGVKAETTSEIVETKHTKTGEDLFVVRLADRVERETYNALNVAAKKLGGWYSSYRGAGAVPGFQFKSRDRAEQFQAVAKGETVDRSEQIAEKKEVRKSATADKLRAVAARMIGAADKSLNADRKTNTAKRAREAGYAESTALAIKATAETMQNIADAIESGEATHLDGVTAKTHIETLDSLARDAKREAERAAGLSYGETERLKYENPTPEQMAQARYPYPHLDHSDLLRMAEEGRKTPGAKLLAERVAKIRLSDPRGTGSGGYLIGQEDIDNVRDLAKKVRLGGGKPHWEAIKWKFDSYDRLQAISLNDLPSLRAALREFTQYRGKRQKVDPLKEMERALVGKNIPGFFPTPPAVIERMLDEAGDLEGKRVLEPSAGKGDIVDAAKAAGAQVDAVEQQSSLRDILQAKGANLVGSDFLTSPGIGTDYDVVLMNPPFENGQDMEHVQYAYKFLKPGGKLVAITSAGPFFRQDAKATGFREWLENVSGTHEALPEGSFKSAFRPTGVSTHLVVIEKPARLASAPLRTSDAEYLAAVERGDMETAQRMVDAVAKAAGYSRRVYHGTEDGGFTEFDPGQTSKKTGFVYMSTGRGTAASYSGSLRSLPAGDEGRGIWSLYVKDPQWVFDFEEADWTGQKPNGDVNEYHDFGGIDGIARDARQSGITSFEVQNVLDEGPNGDTAWYDSTIAVADPSFIKSADPVTRDADGNVIPLSQRFNPKSDSILYSAPATPPADPAKLGTWAQSPLRAIGVPEAPSFNPQQEVKLSAKTADGRAVHVLMPAGEALAMLKRRKSILESLRDCMEAAS